MSQPDKGPSIQHDDLRVAEDYRRQRQESDARKNGFEPIGAESFFKWLADNDLVIREIIKESGTAEPDIQGVVDAYKQTLRTAAGSSFDDPNAWIILQGIIEKIENVCKMGSIPLRGGVVFGVAPEVGAVLRQTSVMTTDASIIQASLPFVAFCNCLSKVLARVLPHDSGKRTVSNDPSKVKKNLERHPEIKAELAKLFAYFALFGWPPSERSESPTGDAKITRLLLLNALEWFAIAHEYGHHALRHGILQSSELLEDHLVHELEADMFARGVSMVLATNEPSANPYALFGVGGVVILGMLELLRRADAILRTGTETVAESATHPPYPERVEAIAVLDDQMPRGYAQAASDMRGCFVEIVEIIWETVRPVFVEMHKSERRRLF